MSEDGTYDTRVFVSRDDHAMLRIDRLNTVVPDPYWERAEVLTYEVLPDTPGIRRLLQPRIDPELDW